MRNLRIVPDWQSIGRAWERDRMIVMLPDGVPYTVGDLLTLQDGQPKFAKDRTAYNVGLMLAAAFAIPQPMRHTFGGVDNTCIARGVCALPCLTTSGQGGIVSGRTGRNNAQDARVARTVAFMTDPDRAVARLIFELDRAQRKANRQGRPLAVRLNTLSDLAWESILPDVYRMFANARFYDYTKRVARMDAYLDGSLPGNLHLTFSRDRYATEPNAQRILARGGNVAVVFSTRKGSALPVEYLGHPVIDGDASDLRYLDPRGVIVGLRAKGRAKADRHIASGFVVDVDAAAATAAA